MANRIRKNSETNKKRLPKGQRTHARRLKQEARKTGSIHK